MKFFDTVDFSPLVDWFWKLEDPAKSNEFRNRFGSTDARFSAMPVIGRSHFLSCRGLLFRVPDLVKCSTVGTIGPASYAMPSH